MLIDVTYFKVRDELHYKNKALFVVAGIKDDGYLEILGTRLADREDSLFWEDLFEDLKERGLKSVKLIVSDGHKGIQKAVREFFYWIKLADVSCTFNKASSKKCAKKEAERSGRKDKRSNGRLSEIE